MTVEMTGSLERHYTAAWTAGGGERGSVDEL